MKSFPFILMIFMLSSCQSDGTEALMKLQVEVQDSIQSPLQDNDSTDNSSCGINLSLEDFNLEEDTVDIGYP